MRSPYSPPETDLGRELVGRSRLRVMLFSAISSIVVAPLLIFLLFYLAGKRIPDGAFVGVALVVIPVSLLLATAIALLNRLPTHVAASLCALITFFLSMTIFIVIGAMLA